MQKAQKFQGIQALRFVAAILVVITHSTFYANERLDQSIFVWKGGTVGVDIFFVISGFVMMVTARPFEVPGGWKNFAVRRLIRIVPMYWIATTVKILTMIALPGAVLHAALTPWSGIASFLFLPTRNPGGSVEPLLGVGWTLTFEMAFYAIFTAALLFRRNVLLFSSVALLVLAGLHAVRGDEDWPTWAFYFDQIVLYFIIGMVIGRVVLSSNPRRNLMFLLTLALAATLIFALLPDGLDWARNAPFRKGVVTAVFLIVVLAEPILARILPKPVLFMGDASYSLYLFHPMLAPIAPVALGIIGVQSGVLSVTASIVGSVIAAAAIYWFVERPLTRKLRKVPYAGVPRPAVVSTPPAPATRP
ncbi:acyltransferase family protein [Rathayibacter sp. VKM Ac-2754]|uniref:acyltransferase family protein n=1 Tax=Rathayibacter sp. VKM Ac-2754 TaxID=2609251 RepID=UPI0013580028|nr:acyltransferase [Rathayibacter sp. VKM Ac-2754]MWV59432.1 acyltransferase family protein [Rathayibacter sp. VKM Ac-2754]